jgi:hypothetical protein
MYIYSTNLLKFATQKLKTLLLWDRGTVSYYMVGETLCREVSSDGEHLTQRDAASFPEESMIILFDDGPCA